MFGYLVLILSGLFVLFYRLGSLLPGISTLEANTATLGMQLHGIIERPINFSYYLLEYISTKIFGPTALAIRLPSVILAIASIALFFFIIKDRFTKRAAIVSSLVFIVSSWYLHYARMGFTGVLTIFLILALIFVALHLNKKYNLYWLLLLVAVAALSLYTPYFLYILIAGVLVSIVQTRPSYKKIKINDLLIATGIFLLLIAPLVYATFFDTSIVKELLAIPDSFPSFSQYFQNLYNIVAYIIFRSEPLPGVHLGDLPMLEIFSVSMVALGLYHYDNELSRALSRLIMGGLLVSVLLLAFSADQLDYSLLIPFIYFLLAGGLVVLFTQWNEIFPKNPIARLIAIVPIAVLLIIVAQYHMNRYFIAWPRTPEVVREYHYTYTALESQLRLNSVLTTVLTDQDETQLTKPLSLYYQNAKFANTAAGALDKGGSNRLIITDKAYNGLSKENKEALGESTSKIPGILKSQPTVLWIYDVSM